MDSPCGDHGFYVSWFAAYTCQALSCICWLVWADTVSEGGGVVGHGRRLHFQRNGPPLTCPPPSQNLHWKWTRVPMIMACSVAAISAIVIDVGSLWCLLGGDATLVKTNERYVMSYDQVNFATQAIGIMS